MYQKLLPGRWLLIIDRGVDDIYSTDYFPPASYLADLPGSDPRWHPYKLKPRCGKNLIGDLKVTVEYGLVTVRFQDEKGLPLLNEEVGNRGIWLRLKKSESRTVFAEGGVSRRATDLAGSAVRLAVPQGKWIMELRTDTGGWIPGSSPVTSRVSTPSELLIVVPRDQW